MSSSKSSLRPPPPPRATTRAAATSHRPTGQATGRIHPAADPVGHHHCANRSLRRHPRRRRRGSRSRHHRHRPRPSATGATTACAAAEHLHLIADDLGGKALVALFVLPLTRAQAAFDVDLRAFAQVLAGDLRQLSEQGDAVPLRTLLVLAGRAVLPVLGRWRCAGWRPSRPTASRAFPGLRPDFQ